MAGTVFRTQQVMVIPLTQGQVAEIDNADWLIVKPYKWQPLKKGRIVYAKMGTPHINGRQKTILMHRMILGLTGRFPNVDHVDGNGLNNRRKNLRICTHSQNMANRGKYKKKSSKFKGVSLVKRSGRFQARIRVNKKLHYIASFKTEIEAARAYDQVAIRHFGEFARLNFP